MNGTTFPPAPPADAPAPRRLLLRDLPLPGRLVLTAFLLSVGIGYVSALVQLHFKHTRDGSPLPSVGDAKRIFHGDDSGPPRMIAMLEAPISASFGKESMREAFSERERGKSAWEEDLEAVRKAHPGLGAGAAKTMLQEMRETERLAVLAWLHAGAPREAHDGDNFLLPADLNARPLLPSLKGSVGSFKLRTALGARCVTCHKTGSQAPALGEADVNGDLSTTYRQIEPFAATRGPEMALDSLAQTTHVHLLGFSMLYGLTGLILAFSGLPLAVRLVLCPLPLVVQVLDISCWWLARLDKPLGPLFAYVIPVTGGLVAVGLLLHILLGVFDMYGRGGKTVLVLAFVGVAAGGFLFVKPIVEKKLDERKKEAAAVKKGDAPEKEK